MSKKAKEKTTLFVVAVLIGLCGVSIGFGQTAGPVVPWSHADVGSPEAGDAVTADGKIFEITGAGADIWGTADNFHYMFIPLTGDGAMSVLVTDNGTGTSNWTKGGVMIRETLDAGSKNVFVAITGGDGEGSTFQYRNAIDAASASNRTKPAPVSPPYWVRLVREGNTFAGYLSEDGETWYSEGASQEIEMADPVYIGLAVTSHTAGELRTFIFENVVGEGNAALADPGIASEPNPRNDSSDVWLDSSLSWKPSIYSAKHNIYVGDSVEDVNAATVPTASNLDVNSFDADRFAFGETYFWRVDEVNTSPDRTVRKGNVWNFTAEPYSIPIPGDAIVATSSSVSTADPDVMSAQRTIDGSGLTGDAHSNTDVDMWLSQNIDFAPWLQYEFDKPYKLDNMMVWNANQGIEATIGWGAKDVKVETSLDGVEWTVVDGITQFTRASGAVEYYADDVFALDGRVVKYVKISLSSNWGGLPVGIGLSEVRFSAIPTYARQPNPDSGAKDVLPDAVASWRPGRGAAEHTVALSTDPGALTDGEVVLSNSIALDTFDLQLGTTYYWNVTESDDASVWTSDTWNLTTAQYLIVDDFESYSNLSPNRPFQTWLDGYGYSPDEFFPVEYNGNGTGSGIGHDIWSISSPHFEGSIMETTNTAPGSSQAMPFYYSNAGAVASQTERTFAAPQDWTLGGVKTLSIALSGQAGNTGALYVKINNTKVTYQGDIALGLWRTWEIDLASVNENLQSITRLQIGVDGSGASGLILIDDITLGTDPVAPENDGPTIVWVSFHGGGNAPSSGAVGDGFTEAPDKAYTDLLQANGYNVIRYLTTNAPDVDTLNTVDLVIISRSVASSGYQDDGATAWNSVASPMMITGGYTTRSSRMGFTTGATMVDTTGDIALTVNAPSHPIFAGINLTGGTMVNPFAGVVVYPTDGTTLARGISINNDPLNADGTLLAIVATDTDPAVGGMVIGEWQAGATLTHTGGAGTDTLAGHRLVFLTGAREANGSSGETAGLYDLYEDGEQMLLNAVEYMLLP